MRPDRFTDKVAFITGGGQGMGQQLALDLANEGAKVAIVDIDQAALDETRKLLDEMGAESLLSICDIAS
ncbi:MAG: SDR family NAD(P)-dependent oxidoreductase, partial [Sphaerochaetaceae bacterium]|nr:SDR family NAD(P)-dependent oxidoreductase [Sphaerochaetaceae bacterium]